MTTEAALGVIWVLTMIGLGLAITRKNVWKQKHDFDHRTILALNMVLNSTLPTDRTLDVVNDLNQAEWCPIEFDAGTMAAIKASMEARGD